MNIKEILKGLPGNLLFQKYKSQYMCEAISVEEILHIEDDNEYEKWEHNNGFHIAKIGDNEVTYSWLGIRTSWYRPKEPFYGEGRYLNDNT